MLLYIIQCPFWCFLTRQISGHIPGRSAIIIFFCFITLRNIIENIKPVNCFFVYFHITASFHRYIMGHRSPFLIRQTIRLVNPQFINRGRLYIKRRWRHVISFTKELHLCIFVYDKFKMKIIPTIFQCGNYAVFCFQSIPDNILAIIKERWGQRSER